MLRHLQQLPWHPLAVSFSINLFVELSNYQLYHMNLTWRIKYSIYFTQVFSISVLTHMLVQLFRTVKTKKILVSGDWTWWWLKQLYHFYPGGSGTAITITGTGFGTTRSAVTVTLGGVAQTVTTVTDTAVTIALTDAVAKAHPAEDIVVYVAGRFTGVPDVGFSLKYRWFGTFVHKTLPY